jgi:SHS2 domain-containing protein
MMEHDRGDGGVGGSGGIPPGWEHFSHQADVGLRGRGRSIEEAFEQAAIALTAVLTDPERVNSREPVEIHAEAPDHELLLVDWLNAIVFQMATRRMIFGRFEVSLQGGTLQARAWGEPLDPGRHRPAVEVKGATYTELAVRREATGGWLAQCVVDV